MSRKVILTDGYLAKVLVAVRHSLQSMTGLPVIPYKTTRILDDIIVDSYLLKKYGDYTHWRADNEFASKMWTIAREITEEYGLLDIYKERAVGSATYKRIPFVAVSLLITHIKKDYNDVLRVLVTYVSMIIASHINNFRGIEEIMIINGRYIK